MSEVTSIVDRLLRAANEAVEVKLRALAAEVGIDGAERRTCATCGLLVAGWVGTRPGWHLVILDRPVEPMSLDLNSDGYRVKATVSIELGLCAAVNGG